MLLAGNGLSAASNMAEPKVQAPNMKLTAGDGVPVSQPANTAPSSGLSSPLFVSSHAGAQSGSDSTSTDEFLAAKTTGAPATPVSNAEPPKVVNATAMLTSGMLEISFLTLLQCDVSLVLHYFVGCSCLGIFVSKSHVFDHCKCFHLIYELSFMQLCHRLAKHP